MVKTSTHATYITSLIQHFCHEVVKDVGAIFLSWYLGRHLNQSKNIFDNIKLEWLVPNHALPLLLWAQSSLKRIVF